jgi:thioredoxin 1
MKSTFFYWLAGLVALAIGIGLYTLSAKGSGTASAAVSAPAAGPIAGNGQPTLIELGMNSCASCKAMHRVLDELRAAHGEHLRVIAIDIRDRPELVAELRVMAIPTQVLLDGAGREVDRHLGFLPAEAIRERFAAHGLPLKTVAGNP